MRSPRNFRAVFALALVFGASSCEFVNGVVEIVELVEAELADEQPSAVDPSFAAQGMQGGEEQQQPSAPLAPPQATTVEVYDKGLQMVRSTFELPAGWRIHQDIATNPRNGQIERYVLDYYGPRGELIRSSGAVGYYGPLGQRFDKMWPKTVRQQLQGVVTDLELGEQQPSETLRKLPTVQQLMKQMPIDAFEIALSGVRDGQPIAGRAYVLNVPFPQDRTIGSYAANSVIASPEHLEDALQIALEIGLSDRANPELAQRMSQINKGIAARSARDHQARMRANQASFDAHQQRMKSQSAAFDQANQAWLNDFRGGGSAQGGSGYGSHEYHIDSIHEQNSFHDPSTGQRTTRSGQHKYNFTDGQGNFYGTDDPSFNPNSLQGDWQATSPLTPEY